MKWKICPFCGSTNTELTNEALDRLDYYQVLCQSCYARGPLGDTIEEALSLWNIRRRKAKRTVNDGESNQILAMQNMQACQYK